MPEPGTGKGLGIRLMGESEALGRVALELQLVSYS